MANNETLIPIPGRLHSVTADGITTGANEIFDDTLNKDQATINQEVNEALGTGGSVDEKIASAVNTEKTRAQSAEEALDGRVDSLESAVGTGGSVDSRIASAVAAETSRAQTAEENLRQLYNSLSKSQPIPVTSLPTTGEAGKIYRLAGTNSYADYMYAEGALTTPIKMAEYDNAIDDEPTAGSDNLVKSGGVRNAVEDVRSYFSKAIVYPTPLESYGNKYYNVPNNIAPGDIISLSDRNIYKAYKYSVKQYESYNITIRPYNVKSYIIFVDENMGYITECAIDETIINKIDVIVPTNASYMLVNSYSNSAICIQNLYIECGSSEDIQLIEKLYSPKLLTPIIYGGHYIVSPETPTNTVVEVSGSLPWKYAILPVNEKEKYKITYRLGGGSAKIPIVFVDNEYKLIATYGFGIEDSKDDYGVKTVSVRVPHGSSQMIINSYSNEQICTKENDISELENIASSNILYHNKDVEHIVNAVCNYGDAKSQRISKMFGLLVSADIHSDADRFNRTCEYLEKMNALDAGICLGDIEAAAFAGDISYYINALNGLSKNYLTVIGNHDAGNTNKVATSGTVAQVYEKFIQPTLNRIGDDTISTTYYCKKFDAYKLAFIILNAYDAPDTLIDADTFAVSRGAWCISQTQINWLISTLENMPSDYHVVLCYHFIDKMINRVESVFSDDFSSYVAPVELAYDGILGDIINAWKTGGVLSASYAPQLYTEYLPTLNVNCDFSNRGNGIFVGHFVGHGHRDYIGTMSDHSDQKVFMFGCGLLSNPNFGDISRVIGTKSEDLATVVAFDTTNRAITLVRIGASVTYKAVDRKVCRISY